MAQTIIICNIPFLRFLEFQVYDARWISQKFSDHSHSLRYNGSLNRLKTFLRNPRKIGRIDLEK